VFVDLFEAAVVRCPSAAQRARGWNHYRASPRHGGIHPLDSWVTTRSSKSCQTESADSLLLPIKCSLDWFWNPLHPLNQSGLKIQPQNQILFLFLLLHPPLLKMSRQATEKLIPVLGIKVKLGKSGIWLFLRYPYESIWNAKPEFVPRKRVASYSGALVAFLASCLNGAGLTPLAGKNNRFTRFRRGGTFFYLFSETGLWPKSVETTEPPSWSADDNDKARSLAGVSSPRAAEDLCIRQFALVFRGD